MTSNPALILFFIELILLLTYIVLPKIIMHISNKEGVPILEGSVFLNKENTEILKNCKKEIKKEKQNSYEEKIVEKQKYRKKNAKR